VGARGAFQSFVKNDSDVQCVAEQGRALSFVVCRGYMAPHEKSTSILGVNVLAQLRQVRPERWCIRSAVSDQMRAQHQSVAGVNSDVRAWVSHSVRKC
jgi:hypothetical protein